MWELVPSSTALKKLTIVYYMVKLKSYQNPVKHITPYVMVPGIPSFLQDEY